MLTICQFFLYKKKCTESQCKPILTMMPKPIVNYKGINYQAELNHQNKLGALVLFLDQFIDFETMEEHKQSKRSMARQFAQDVLKF